jgi:hypothetical protein
MVQTDDLGDCYEAAAKYVLEHLDTILVHGQPYLLRNPYTQFGHAWVETEQGMVIDVANGQRVELPISVYYALGLIDPEACDRYPHQEVRRWILETEHWGPWKKRSEKRSGKNN